MEIPDSVEQTRPLGRNRVRVSEPIDVIRERLKEIKEDAAGMLRWTPCDHENVHTSVCDAYRAADAAEKLLALVPDVCERCDFELSVPCTCADAKAALVAADAALEGRQ